MTREVEFKHLLLDALREWYGFTTDRQLAKELKVLPSALAKIRHGTHNVSPQIMISVHKATGWPFDRIELLCPSRDSAKAKKAKRLSRRVEA
jgi:transcriptional regulator with XRE-family HTH domain